ncbi:zf-CCHC domain-containing protein [Tanacetum coccineum]
MTRISTKELFAPFENPKQEFCLSRKLFKTHGLDESSSPEFDLFSDLEENSKEEVAETMAETMEQHMRKLELTMDRELRDNTFNGSVYKDANEHIKIVVDIVDLFHIPNITQDQIMLRAFPMSLTGAASRWLRNKPTGSISTWEDLKAKFLILTRQILDSKGVIPTKTTADTKVVIQELAEYSQKWHNGTSKARSTKTSDGLAAIQAQLNNLGREIKKVNEKVYAAQVGCELWQYRAATLRFYQRNNANPSYQERRQSTEESLSKKISRVLQERGFRSLPSSTETNPRDHVNSISTIDEAETTLIRRIRSTQYAVSAQQNSKLIFRPSQATVPFPSRLYDDSCDEKNGSCRLHCLDAYLNRTTLLVDFLPKKEKDPGSFTLLCYINNVCFEKTLADLGASVSVMPLSTYLNIGLGKLAHTKLTVELADRIVKHPKGIAKNVLVGIGKFVFLIDFIILDMPKDVNVPLILRRSFLSTAHAKVDVFKRKITLRVGEEKIIFKNIKPAYSLIKRVYMLSLRERMDLDLEARLMGETLILNRSLDPLYGDYIELNNLNEPLKLRRN